MIGFIKRGICKLIGHDYESQDDLFDVNGECLLREVCVRCGDEQLHRELSGLDIFNKYQENDYVICRLCGERMILINSNEDFNIYRCSGCNWCSLKRNDEE